MKYHLRFVHRQSDGTVSRPLHERVIDAASAQEAIGQARLIDADVDALGANALYLSDEGGNVLWSLRRPDASE